MRRFLMTANQIHRTCVYLLLIWFSLQASTTFANSCEPSEFWYCNPEFENDCFCAVTEEPVEKLTLQSTEERRLQAMQEARESCESNNGSFSCNEYTGNDCTCTAAEIVTKSEHQNEEGSPLSTTNASDSESGKTAENTDQSDTGNNGTLSDNQTASAETTTPINPELVCSKYDVDITTLDGHIKDCMKDRSETATWCEAGNSSSINGALTAIQGLARTITLGGAMGGSVNSPTSACSDIGKISRTALGALSTYRAACAPKKKFCENTCDDAVQYYEKLSKHIKDNDDACFEKFKKDYVKIHDPKYTKSASKKKKSIFHARKKCKGFAKDILMSAVDAGAIYASMKQAESCDEQVADVAKNFCQEFPDSPVCASTQGAMDCQSNPNSAFCICQTNPQDPLCLSIAGGVGSNPRNSTLPGGSSISQIGAFGDVGGGGNVNPGDIKGSFASASPGAGLIAPVKPGTSKVNPIPAGSGAKLGGGSGGGSGRSNQASRGRRARASAPRTSSSSFARSRKGIYPFKSGSLGSKKLRTRIVARRPAKSNGNMIDLKKFLPGGDKDPRRKRFAGLAREDGITGSMGPSLFQKISRRYGLVEAELFQEKVKFRYKIPRRRRN